MYVRKSLRRVVVVARLVWPGNCYAEYERYGNTQTQVNSIRRNQLFTSSSDHDFSQRVQVGYVVHRRAVCSLVPNHHTPRLLV
jgi:hypothetical protein